MAKDIQLANTLSIDFAFTRIEQPNRAPAGVQVSASLMRSFRNLPHRHHPRAKPAGFNDPLLVWERRLAND